MLRPSREWTEETPGARFGQVLAEVRRTRTFEGALVGEDGDFGLPPPSLPLEALLSIDKVRTEAPGDASHWAAALAWLEELEEPAALAAAPQRPKDDSLDAIREELGLTGGLTREKLRQLRRLFMWRHHPDRQSEAERESATRRAAIANMLIDQAEAPLADDGEA